MSAVVLVSPDACHGPLPDVIRVFFLGDNRDLVRRGGDLHHCPILDALLVCDRAPGGYLAWIDKRTCLASATGATPQEAVDRLRDAQGFAHWLASAKADRAKVAKAELERAATRARDRAAREADREWVDLIELMPPESGGVYVVQGVPGWVKIGRARNIARRVLALQHACPVEVRLLAILSDDPDDELGFHYRFKHLRERGEWFRVDHDLRDAILEANRTSWSAER